MICIIFQRICSNVVSMPHDESHGTELLLWVVYVMYIVVIANLLLWLFHTSGKWSSSLFLYCSTFSFYLYGVHCAPPYKFIFITFYCRRCWKVVSWTGGAWSTPEISVENRLHIQETSQAINKLVSSWRLMWFKSTRNPRVMVLWDILVACGVDVTRYICIFSTIFIAGNWIAICIALFMGYWRMALLDTYISCYYPELMRWA